MVGIVLTGETKMRNLGTHVLLCPSGRYTFVGSVPVELCDIRPATKSDVMGGRAYEDESGATVCARPRVFDTESAAREAAIAAGVNLAN